jgi:hypothetical protein
MDPRAVGLSCWKALCSVEGMIHMRVCMFHANSFLCECTDEGTTNCSIAREQYHLLQNREPFTVLSHHHAKDYWEPGHFDHDTPRVRCLLLR